MQLSAFVWDVAIYASNSDSLVIRLNILLFWIFCISLIPKKTNIFRWNIEVSGFTNDKKWTGKRMPKLSCSTKETVLSSS